MPLRLDHVGIAVWDLRPAARFWGELLGGEFKQGAAEYAGFSYLQFAFGPARVELLSPVEPGGFLRRFLERHGEGVHHLTFIADDVRAEVARLRAAGERIVDEDYSNPHWREAFLDAHLGPRRLLVQIGETDLEDIAELDRRFNLDPIERVLEVAAARLERD